MDASKFWVLFKILQLNIISKLNYLSVTQQTE